MRYDQYYSDFQPKRIPLIRRIIITAAVLIAVLALYGWMGSRDAEPQLPTQLPIVTYDCAPAMEMDMPIDMGSVRL